MSEAKRLEKLWQLCFESLRSSRSFLSPQLDTEYRKKWDALVIKLEVIERDVVSGSEVLHWVTHFPVSVFTPVFPSITFTWNWAITLAFLFLSIRCTHGIMFMSGGIAWIRRTTWWCWCRGMCCYLGLLLIPSAGSFMHAVCVQGCVFSGPLWWSPGPTRPRQNVRWKGYKLFFKPFFQFLSVDNFKKKCSVFSTPQWAGCY